MVVKNSDREQDIYEMYMEEYRISYPGAVNWEDGCDIHRQARVIARIVDRFLREHEQEEREEMSKDEPGFTEKRAARYIKELEEHEDIEFPSYLRRSQ